MAINSWDVLIRKIIQWQRESFPNVSAPSSARHLLQESGELMHDPFDAEEWADAFFIVLQGADRIPLTENFTAEEAGAVLFAALIAKFEKNKLRTWKAPDEHGVVGHASEGACPSIGNGEVQHLFVHGKLTCLCGEEPSSGLLETP